MSNLTQFTEACESMKANTLKEFGNSSYAAGYLGSVCLSFFELLPPEVQAAEIKNMKYTAEQYKQK
jgi:hypothetical protein